MAPSPKRSRLRGWLWKLAGIMFFVLAFGWSLALAMAGVITFDEAQQIPPEPGWILFGLAGVKCYLRGKRHMAIAATELLSKDTRPPVIYLRSFQHDKAGSGSVSGSRFWGGWEALFDLTTVEERLAEAFGVIGPVVAIGKPGEKLPALGAARLYVGDDEWQETVHALMERARLVVLLLGDTPGFWWELEHAVKGLPPEKLVLIVPFKKKRYDTFRERAAQHFPHPLPEFGSTIGFTSFRFRPRRGLGKLVGLIHFGRDWSPSYVDLTRMKWPWRMLPNYYGRRRFERSLNWNLRPVLQRLGLPWTPPKPKRASLALASVVLLFFTIGMIGTAVTVVPEFLKSRRETAARTAAYEAFVTRVQQSPDVRAAYGPLTADEAAAKGLELARAGVLRLDDAAVIERQRIVGELISGSSVTCMATLIEGADPVPNVAALAYEAPEVAQAWYRILGDAAIAEARQSPDAVVLPGPTAAGAYAAYARRHPTDRFSEVLFIVRENSKSPATKRVLAALEFGDPYGFVQVYETDICRVFGELNKGAATLPPPFNAQLARALAGGVR